MRSESGRVLHLDCFSGIAGNMMLAALLDLGLSRKELEAGLAGLGLEFKLRVKKVSRGALAAKHLEVVVPGAKKKRAAKAKKKPGHTHSHSHEIAEPHIHVHGHHHGHGRAYPKIRRQLERADLAERVKARTLACFEALAIAEGRVHGVSPEEVHFHEVGAVDAIVDITGMAIGLEALGIERVTSSPVALGHGTVYTDHGLLPLPAPATIELLRGVPTVPANVEWETVTPTGAAILRSQVDDFGVMPAMTIDRIGLGAGNDRPGPMPNVLRAVLGEVSPLSSDRIVCLECNLDDFNPEHFDYLMERLFEAGALDVSLQNVQMKKNRPGFLVRVLARPDRRLTLTQLLLTESTTLGVRATDWDRVIVPRETRKISTPFGRIGVKFVTAPDGRIEVSAEYDDCKHAARKHEAPLRDVVRAAEDAAREELA